ncbi:MAG: hypothetical protein NXI19_03590 [Alphaproteobacteria bacterium]|nr:hypothetical protein [Alphaproteobacteria bacterium]
MLPPEKVFRGRLDNLTRIGYMVANRTSLAIQKKHGLENCVAVSSAQTYLRFNARYWKLVHEFKQKNFFPDGNRINSPKKAAITTYAIATSEEPLFTTRSKLDKSHYDYAVLQFALTSMKMFMKIESSAISQKHKRDLNSCLFKISDEGAESDRENLHLLCLYMDTYWSPAKESADNGVDD